MKKTIAMIMSVGLMAGVARADILVSDDFDYADGPLVGNTPAVGDIWTTISGISGEIPVFSGAITLSDASSEDIESGLGSSFTTGALYFGFDISVADPGSYTGTDFEYFAHFSGSTFTLRTDIGAFSATGWRPGAATTAGTAEALWGSDLSYATVYRLVGEYNFSTGLSSLWVDPASEGDIKITSTNAVTGITLDAFNFRQSAATPDQSITIDNLRVATTFAEAATVVPEPATMSMLLLGLVGARGLVHRRKRA